MATSTTTRPYDETVQGRNLLRGPRTATSGVALLFGFGALLVGFAAYVRSPELALVALAWMAGTTTSGSV